MKKMLKVYAIRTDRKSGQSFRGTVEEVADESEVLQRFVNYDEDDGTIAVASLSEDIIIIHEDMGKYKEFPPTRFWVDDSGRVLDVLVGNLLLCRANEETGELADIQSEDIFTIQKYLLPAFQIPNGRYVVMPHENWLPEYQEGCVEKMSNRKKASIYELMYPRGTKLRLTKPIQDPYTPKQVGDIFTSSGVVDDEFQLSGSWESGGSMSLRLTDDSFEVVKE